MDPRVKTKWVEALRSGYYKQGKSMLRDLGDYYDPTGVLCELAVQENVIPQARRFDKSNAEVFFGHTYGVKPDAYATGLPEAVRNWSGVNYYIGMKVAHMGDLGKSFAHIADWIEENL